MSREQFLEAVQKKIVADRIVGSSGEHSNHTSLAPGHVGSGEMKKVMHSFLHDMQSLFPAFAAATC